MKRMGNQPILLKAAVVRKLWGLCPNRPWAGLGQFAGRVSEGSKGSTVGDTASAYFLGVSRRVVLNCSAGGHDS